MASGGADLFRLRSFAGGSVSCSVAACCLPNRSRRCRCRDLWMKEAQAEG